MRKIVIRRPGRLVLASILGALMLTAAVLVYDELAHTSELQARYFSSLAREATFQLDAGASDTIAFPAHGPSDRRRGYVDLPGFITRLQADGCTVVEQARWSEGLTQIVNRGLYPPFRESAGAGMRIFDRSGTVLLQHRYPERAFERFEDIPGIVVRTLLHIEDRDLLDDQYPRHNPAIEFDRLARASLDRAVRWVVKDHPSPGASTLATQIEKYRHSPEGRTDSVREKLLQMGSASLRAYLDGEDTRPRRRGIVLEYLNTVPLGARGTWGEVHGLGDALWVYFGRELDEVRRRLTAPEADDTLSDRAAAYKAVLGLLLAQRRPSALLGADSARLSTLIERHLGRLVNAGIISAKLRDATHAAPLVFRSATATDLVNERALPKATDAIRTHLAERLGVPRRYDLDRLDVTVASTLDDRAQTQITAALRALSGRDGASAAGLTQAHMLGQNDPARVVYGVTLYQKRDQAFRLLVQADNLDQAFDVNEGLKLDLGSTAKLRTLISYLEIVAELHARLSGLDRQALQASTAAPEDRLTRWAIEHLREATDTSLSAMLETALDRRYSASPAEGFFTGGGLHRFSNFSPSDDVKVPSVREGFRDSVNLVFIRLMRDIVQHYIYRDGNGNVLRDRADPRRAEFLARFADEEGQDFLLRYFRTHRDLGHEERIASLIGRRAPTTARLASIFRSIAPGGYQEAYRAFRTVRGGDESGLPPVDDIPFERYAPERLDLNDRAYVAGIHPLELWLVAYLYEHPQAVFAEIVTAGAEARQSAYRWLFRTSRPWAQDQRIRTMLESDAFVQLHRSWQRAGYPFDSLVPSYATAIGASADRPASLALLMGTLLADGVRLPISRVTQLRFAAHTPYETALACRPNAGERVFPPELARAARNALVGVVADGTAVRAKGMFEGMDPPVTIGGKTGTGDHRYKTFSAGGVLRDSRAVSRAGTFVFFVGNDLFGVVTAYVPGAIAAQYEFTSSLPVQVLRHLEPTLAQLLAPPAP